MIHKQMVAIAGAAPGILTVLLVWRYASRLFASAHLPQDNAADRLVFAVQWLLIPGLTLLAGIWVASRADRAADHFCLCVAGLPRV
jgi:hypothetical protein